MGHDHRAGHGSPVTRVVGYAYPWDYVGDPGATERAASMGLDAVAVAASYHSTRASTPLHPEHRLVEAAESACYVPVREQAWRGHRLVPARPLWDPDGESFDTAARHLHAVGLDVDAWIVLTHNDTLGARHPDLVVRNAFGDALPYALCPGADDVQEYCVTLVEEIVRSVPVDGVVLESCGPMGIEHAGAHDKIEFAGWDAVRQVLLSVCFCAACTARYPAAGLDADHVAATVRAGVGSACRTVDECLGEDLAAQLVAIRTDVAEQLRTRLVAASRSEIPRVRVTVHGSGDPWATGSFATLAPVAGDGLDAVVASCWDPVGATARIDGLRALASARTSVGAYLRLDRGWPPGEPTEDRLRQYVDVGMSELHLYHLGLLGLPGLAAMRHVIDAAGRSAR